VRKAASFLGTLIRQDGSSFLVSFVLPVRHQKLRGYPLPAMSWWIILGIALQSACIQICGQTHARIPLHPVTNTMISYESLVIFRWRVVSLPDAIRKR
jgi:hypothetical protein